MHNDPRDGENEMPGDDDRTSTRKPDSDNSTVVKGNGVPVPRTSIPDKDGETKTWEVDIKIPMIDGTEITSDASVSGIIEGRKVAAISPPGPPPSPRAVKDKGPSCADFADWLVKQYQKSWTGEGFAWWAVRRAKNNPYDKTLVKDHGFKPKLVANGQDGDVYRHILFFAGLTVAERGGANPIATGTKLGAAIVDAKQSLYDGRKESDAELADDVAGTHVGNELRAWTGSYDQMKKRVKDWLCEDTE